METQILLKLQKIYSFIAWGLLVLTLVFIGLKANTFLSAPTETVDLGDLRAQIIPRYISHGEFYFVPESIVLFDSLGYIFFAFLISAVFKMLANKNELNLERAERFLYVTSASFLLKTIFSFIQFVGIVRMGTGGNACKKFLECGVGFELLTLSSNALMFVNQCVPSLLMALTTFILFKHFAKLISFEAEVA
jgi:hypothetical protein